MQELADLRLQKDKISLSAIDAYTLWREIKAPSSAQHLSAVLPVSLAATKSGGDTFVSGDVNGDGVADFLICIDPSTTRVASDFLL